MLNVFVYMFPCSQMVLLKSSIPWGFSILHVMFSIESACLWECAPFSLKTIEKHMKHIGKRHFQALDHPAVWAVCSLQLKSTYLLSFCVLFTNCEVSIRSILEAAHVRMIENASGSMSECVHNASIHLVWMHLNCRMRIGATSICGQDPCCNVLGSHGRLRPEPV